MECPESCRVRLSELKLIICTTSSLGERGMSIWTFMGTWEKDTFRRASLAVSDGLSSKILRKLSVSGSVVAAVCGSASLVAVSSGSYVLADVYSD